MKRILLSTVFLLALTVSAYWVGHQGGQREMKVLMKAYEAASLSSELYHWVGPQRDSEYEQQLRSNLDRTLVYYGAYISNEMPFYQGYLDREKEIESLFENAIGLHRQSADIEKMLSERESSEKWIREKFPEQADEMIREKRLYLEAFLHGKE